MTVVYIIIGILVFGLLIVTHELGHFAAAKACGVRVEEFSVGMGPAIWKKQRGETLYALRCIPFGGYCMMTGEEEEMDDPRAFTSQSPWKRMIILVAGVASNVIVGFLLVFIVYCGADAFRAPIIVDFEESCPYESPEGLQVGDRILSINGNRIFQFTDVSQFLDDEDGVYDMVLRRDGRRVKLEDFRFTPIQYAEEETPKYGLYFGYEMATFGTRVSYSWNTCMEFARLVKMSLREIGRGNVGLQDLSGPVGIVDMMAETGKQAANAGDAIEDILFLGALVAINLAVMNLLPIPGLDGGRIFLLAVTWIVESISGKKLPSRYEGIINTVGMVLLLALMGFVMFNDIFRIIKR